MSDTSLKMYSAWPPVRGVFRCSPIGSRVRVSQVPAWVGRRLTVGPQQPSQQRQHRHQFLHGSPPPATWHPAEGCCRFPRSRHPLPPPTHPPTCPIVLLSSAPPSASPRPPNNLPPPRQASPFPSSPGRRRSWGFEPVILLTVVSLHTFFFCFLLPWLLSVFSPCTIRRASQFPRVHLPNLPIHHGGIITTTATRKSFPRTPTTSSAPLTDCSYNTFLLHIFRPLEITIRLLPPPAIDSSDFDNPLFSRSDTPPPLSQRQASKREPCSLPAIALRFQGPYEHPEPDNLGRPRFRLGAVIRRHSNPPSFPRHVRPRPCRPTCQRCCSVAQRAGCIWTALGVARHLAGSPSFPSFFLPAATSVVPLAEVRLLVARGRSKLCRLPRQPQSPLEALEALPLTPGF